MPEDSLENFDQPTTILGPELFKALDLFKTGSPLLVGRIPEIKADDLLNDASEPTLITALGHPDNLGSLIRSAEAFGVTRIVLLKESAHPFHPKCLRASAGSALRCQFSKGPSLNNLSAVSDLLMMDLHGQNISEFEWPKHFRLLIGSEGMGIPQNLTAQRLHIPMAPSAESLNGGISGSIALYQRWTKVDFKNSK